jgi:tripartite-type tricarboxylate transporter receptor subunit TctC
MIVPFAAGGPADTVGRILAERMRTSLGQTIVIENVPGAGGSIGVGRIARAAPDGYTFGMGISSTQVVNPVIYSLPYDVQTDFEPITLLASNPHFIVAKKANPANDLREFIAWLKANPDKATAGTAGAGSPPHVGAVFFQNLTGTRIGYVPYRGGGPAMQDLIAGRFDYFCTLSGTVSQQIQGKLVKPIAVLSPERSPILPELATAQEQGLKDFEASTWFGFFLPKATPEPVIRRLNEATVATMETPSVQQRLREVGAIIVPPERRSSEYLQTFVLGEIAKNAAPIKAAGISMD